MKVPLGGGAPTLIASGQEHPVNIRVDATSAYWTNVGRVGIDPIDGSVMSAPLSGGTAVTLATGPFPNDLAVDGTSVYWTNGCTNDCVTFTDGTVMKVALAGGPSTTLASAELSQRDRRGRC